MDKALANRALDEAFVAHVGTLFEAYVEGCRAGDGRDESSDQFLGKFHEAKHAYDAAATRLEMTVPDHVAMGPESDDAYRARLRGYRGLRAGKTPWELSQMDREALDSYGVTVGVPRGAAQWNPSVPRTGDAA